MIWVACFTLAVGSQRTNRTPSLVSNRSLIAVIERLNLSVDQGYYQAQSLLAFMLQIVSRSRQWHLAIQLWCDALYWE
jgi:hypothetical protein